MNKPRDVIYTSDVSIDAKEFFRLPPEKGVVRLLEAVRTAMNQTTEKMQKDGRVPAEGDPPNIVVRFCARGTMPDKEADHG